MTTNELTSNTVEPLPDGASHWDRFPNELKSIVFNYAGKHTEFLCDRLGPVAELNTVIARTVWHDAFKSGWLGNYHWLPYATGPNRKFTLDNNDLILVKSRELYEHLGKVFPDMSESNPAYEFIDTNINKGLRFNDKFVVPYEVDKDTNNYGIRLLNIAMRNMWLDVLKDKIKQVPYAVARNCIWRGHVDLLRHLLSNNIVKIEHLKHYKVKNEQNEDRWYQMMNCAAFYGNLDVLKLLHESGGTDITKDAMNWASRDGRLETVKWLHENRREGCTIDAMDLAAANGHLEIVQYLHQHRNEGCTTKAMDDAAANGHLPVVEWLHENRTEGCTTKAMDNTATSGHLHVVEWLHQHREEGCTTAAIDAAAKNGHIEMVDYLLKNRIEGATTAAIDNAAANGHADIVHLLLNHNHKFSLNAFKACKSDEIAEMLIKSMDRQTRIDILTKLLKEDVKGIGFVALHQSFL